MEIRKEFYLPNKGVLSLYNISYLKSEFNLVIKNISDGLKCEASVELYSSFSSKLSMSKDNDLKMIFSDLKTRSEEKKEKPFYMFKDTMSEDELIEYLTPIDYNYQSYLQLFNQINTNSITYQDQINTNSITYQESLYGLSFPTNVVTFDKISNFLNSDNIDKYQKYLREYLQVFNFEYREVYSKEELIKEELNRIIKSDFRNLFSNKYFLEKQIEEEYHRKEEIAKTNERILKLGFAYKRRKLWKLEKNFIYLIKEF